MTAAEICLDDLAGVAIAESCGADRVEFCAALDAGGITPSLGSIRTVINSVSRIDVQVLIRQRPGDFVYTSKELNAMVADIDAIRAISGPPGVKVGFVIGALTPGGEVDRIAVARLRDACGDAPTTFHKAFDFVRDLDDALETLVELGIQRILTAGGYPSALEGVDRLAMLVQRAGSRISIMAGGGVRPNNAAEVIARSGVNEIHLRATERFPSASLKPDPRGLYDSGTRTATSAVIIDEVLKASR